MTSQVTLLVKNPPANDGDARDQDLIPESERSRGVGNGYALLYPCLGNPMNRRAWRATVHGVSKDSGRTEHTHMHRILSHVLLFVQSSSHLPHWLCSKIRKLVSHQLTFLLTSGLLHSLCWKHSSPLLALSSLGLAQGLLSVKDSFSPIFKLQYYFHPIPIPFPYLSFFIALVSL